MAEKNSKWQIYAIFSILRQSFNLVGTVTWKAFTFVMNVTNK